MSKLTAMVALIGVGVIAGLFLKTWSTTSQGEFAGVAPGRVIDSTGVPNGKYRAVAVDDG